MALKVRRVVTGHDKNGHAVFKTDDVVEQGKIGAVIWTTIVNQVNNSSDVDKDKTFTEIFNHEFGITCPGGTVFRIGEIKPGHKGVMHRTNSIDYGIVLEGEIELELDDSKIVHLKVGDVVVQRGTIHAWHNNGDVPAKLAWILVDAKPAKIGDRILEPILPY